MKSIYITEIKKNSNVSFHINLSSVRDATKPYQFSSLNPEPDTIFLKDLIFKILVDIVAHYVYIDIYLVHDFFKNLTLLFRLYCVFLKNNCEKLIVTSHQQCHITLNFWSYASEYLGGKIRMVMLLIILFWLKCFKYIWVKYNFILCLKIINIRFW